MCVCVFACVCACTPSFSHAQFFATPRTVACQVLCLWDSPGKNNGVGCPSLGDLPAPIEPKSLALQVDSLPSEPPGKQAP